MDRGILVAALEKAKMRTRLPLPAERRLVRQRAGISQTDLARALGVDRATVSRWESGDRAPDGARLSSYLDALEQLERGCP